MAKGKLTAQQQLDAIKLAEAKLAEKKAKVLAMLADLSADSKGIADSTPKRIDQIR
jgi:hypothetical protein